MGDHRDQWEAPLGKPSYEPSGLVRGEKDRLVPSGDDVFHRLLDLPDYALGQTRLYAQERPLRSFMDGLRDRLLPPRSGAGCAGCRRS